MSRRFITASLEGRVADASRLIGASLPGSWPDEGARRRLMMRMEQMAREPQAAPWLLRMMVDRDDGRAVGVINFHGRPDVQGRAELGYTVFEEYRRLGYASEAAEAMIRWARREHGIRAFVLSIAPHNDASLRLAGHLGFRCTGSQLDEIDGEEWVFERTVD